MYGQLNYELTDALSITGGLRYSIDDRRVITQSGDVVDNSDEFVRCTPSTVAIPCLRERHKTFTNLSYTAGIDYDLTDNILIYAKYSKGYRSGAMQLRTVTLADSTPSDPEIVHEQEIGIKTTFLRSEEHTSELQSLMRISYAVFCLKKKTTTNATTRTLVNKLTNNT